MPTPQILIVDDDEAVRASLLLLFKNEGFAACAAAGPPEAMKILDDHSFDLIIMDMNFSMSTSGREGLDLLQSIRSRMPQIPIILITAWGSISLAVAGMKLGASDFLNKPWQNDHLLQAVRTNLQLAAPQPSAARPGPEQQEQEDKFDFSKLIGQNQDFLRVLELVRRISPTDASVLICGESGTGKELIAEAIHINSPRQDRPFVKVNLAGIPATLFESEMFGHKKGAFTDARSDRQGRFQAAHSGTLFLDEIGDLSLANQVKILRVLQERSFEPLGSNQTVHVDIRVLSATNRNLDELVGSGAFREDLFYRINLIRLELPSLHERADDIPILVNHFMHNIKTIYRRNELQVTARALRWLQGLPWPGNIRQLKNLVERTVLISPQDILDQEDFAAQIAPPRAPARTSELPPVGSMTIEEMEQSMIRKALEFHGRNISKVAQALGLSRAALYRRLEKYGISP